jgi:hypothetical protein
MENTFCKTGILSAIRLQMRGSAGQKFGAAVDLLQQPRTRAGEIQLPFFLLLLIIIERGCCSKCSLAKMATIVTIKGHRVIDIYESFDGSYWFVTERLWKQDSVIGGKVYKDDQILFGYVRLSSCPEHAEFGNFSETELKLLGNRVWKVPQRNWSVCPEVEVQEAREHRDHHGARVTVAACCARRGGYFHGQSCGGEYYGGSGQECRRWNTMKSISPLGRASAVYIRGACPWGMRGITDYQ